MFENRDFPLYGVRAYINCMIGLINLLQIVNVCLEEMLFDKSLLLEDFNKAKHHLDNIASLDHYSALYRYGWSTCYSAQSYNIFLHLTNPKCGGLSYNKANLMVLSNFDPSTWQQLQQLLYALLVRAKLNITRKVMIMKVYTYLGLVLKSYNNYTYD